MFEIQPHTADARIFVENPRLEGLFEDAASALVAFSSVEWSDRPPVERRMEIESVDRTSLLIDFLNEVIVLLHVERLALTAIDHANINESSLELTATFRVASAWSEDIKAVTYHEAELRCEDGVWSTTIVLDI